MNKYKQVVLYIMCCHKTIRKHECSNRKNTQRTLSGSLYPKKVMQMGNDILKRFN